MRIATSSTGTTSVAPLRAGRRVLASASIAAFLAAATPGTPVHGQQAPAPTWFASLLPAPPDRVVVADDGTIFVAGWADDPDLPASLSSPEPYVTPWGGETGFYFVSAIASDGRFLWTTYARGGFGEYRYAENVTALALGPGGEIWIAGNQQIEPVRAFQPEVAWSPAFVARFEGDGTLSFATHVGGGEEGESSVVDLAVLPDGDAVAVGSTTDRDFPGSLGSEVTSTLWESDAYVTRIASDGSGVRWTRRFGGPLEGWDAYFGGGVAVDPADGAIVATVTGTPHARNAPKAIPLLTPRGIREPRERLFGRDAATFVLRLDGDGNVVRGGALGFLGSETGYISDYVRPRTAVSVAPDGSVLVGGVRGVARLSASLTAVEAAWTHGLRYSRVRRISVDPSGRVVVAEEPTYNASERTSRIVVLDAGLGSEREIQGVAFVPHDANLDAAGNLLVVGRGDGVPFASSVVPAAGAWGNVAKLPLDGIRPPSRVEVRVPSPESIEVSWPHDGDPAAVYEVELPVQSVAATVPSTGRSALIGGLAPATTYSARVVSVFASGVRTASPAAQGIATQAVAPTAVAATGLGGQRVEVAWTTRNGDLASYEIERRIGDGPWLPTGSRLAGGAARKVGAMVEQGPVVDVVPEVGVPVTYRVRARDERYSSRQRAWKRRSSPWVESGAVVLSRTLRVGQDTGHLGPLPAGGEFAVTGSLASADGASTVSFDPASDDLRLLFGDAAAPYEFVLPARDLGWTSQGGVHSWSGARSLTPWEDASEVILDLPGGRYSVRLVSGFSYLEQTTRAVCVNFAFGSWRGGDVTDWRGRAGKEPDLSLGADAEKTRGTPSEGDR